MIGAESIVISGGWRGRVAAIVVFCGLIAGAAPRAEADDCLGVSMTLVRPEDSKLFLDLRHKDDVWQARVSTYGTNDGAWRTLEGVPSHGHLIAVGPTADGTFAIIRRSAETGHEDRVLFYSAFVTTRSRPGLAQPVWRLALKDLLTADELARVQRSVSHLHWLEGASPVSGLKLIGYGGSFDLKVLGGRDVKVAFPERGPRAPKPWSIPPF